MRLFQYQIKAEPVSTLSERITPDKWTGSAEAPRNAWAKKVAIAAVVLAANTAFAFTPVPLTSPDKWLPEIKTPRWNVKREQYKYPSVFYADIPRAESVTIDRWHPSIQRPRWDRKRNQYLYPASVLGDVPRSENVSIDRWHPAIEVPRWDRKRTQYLFPASVLGDIPRSENVSIDRWHPELEKPRWDRKRHQYTYPSSFLGDIPRSEPASIDRWHPSIENPQWDRKRQQYEYPSLFYSDIPRSESVTVDRWHPDIERPPASLRRNQYLAPYFFNSERPIENVTLDRWFVQAVDRQSRKFAPITESTAFVYPIPNAVPFEWHIQNSEPLRLKPRIVEAVQSFNPIPIVPFGWQIQNAEPFRGRARVLAEASVFVYPVASPPVTVPFDWQSQQPDPIRLKTFLREQNLFVGGSPIVPSDWQTALGVRLPGAVRRVYLYDAAGFVFSLAQQTVTMDMWNPAQVYQRPLVVPLYWLPYGEINNVIPGVHLPCILEANATLVQPVNYQATLVQPVEYDATLVQPVNYNAEEIDCD